MVLIPVLLSALLWYPGREARAAWFVRGDFNSSGTVNVSDALLIFWWIFQGPAPTPPCLDAADVDDSGAIDLSDGIALISYLFLAAPRPGPMLAVCWFDPADDPLDCQEFQGCSPGVNILVLDKSGSMISGMVFRRLQMLGVRAIQALSTDDAFAVVFFDSGLYKFPNSGQPAMATVPLKAAGLAYVMSTQPGSGTCAKPALSTALEIASKSNAGPKQILFFSDGLQACSGMDQAQYAQEILDLVKDQNPEQIPVHAICIGRSGEVDESFMRKLAGQNGGFYLRIISN